MIADRRATAWLRQADRDLAHARRSSAQGDPEWACYAAQQAAEKALKAVLIDLGRRPPSVHDLMALAQMVVEAGAMEAGALADLGDLVALTEFNITARYPLGDGLMAPGDAISPRRVEEALETAGHVLERARMLLEGPGA